MPPCWRLSHPCRGKRGTDVAQILLSVLLPKPPGSEGLRSESWRDPAQTRVSVPHLKLRLRPHFLHAEWNCRHSVGGETWDDVELCEQFILGNTSNRESFSPSAFQLGEKVPKADEGAFHEFVICAPSSVLGPASVNREYLVKHPPHPPSAPSPPARNRGGRRALDEGSGKALEGTNLMRV